MNNNLKIFISILVLIATVLAFTSCDKIFPIEANFCQHRDIDDNGICDNEGCGEEYSDGVDLQHDHEFGEWVMQSDDKSITCDKRVFYRICSVCKAIEWKSGDYSDHDFGEDYVRDSFGHYFACEHCNATESFGEHIYNESGACSVCGCSLSDLPGDGDGVDLPLVDLPLVDIGPDGIE